MPKTQAHPPSAGPPGGREPSPRARLNALLSVLWEHNPFYARKWRTAGVPAGLVSTPADLGRFPLTTRAELLADQAAAPPLGTNLTFPIAEYKRVHRSSGTTRSPLVWVDTGPSWQSVMACSQKLFRLAGVTGADRLFFAMPFTGSSGPWIMFEGACRLGCACGTAAGGEAVEQLQMLRSFQPNVLLGKPGRLRALALAAKMSGLNPSALGVQKLILGGETVTTCFRQELEHHWSAPSFDRYGLTEAGSVAGECAARSGGLHVLDDEFLCEAIHPASAEPVPDGEVGELVLTNLGRSARPIVRYRTGDLVRLVRNHQCSCGRAGSFLLGGVSRMRAVPPAFLTAVNGGISRKPYSGLVNTKYFAGLASLVTGLSLAWAGNSSSPALFAGAAPNATVGIAAASPRDAVAGKPSGDAISIDLKSEQGLLEMRFKNGKLLTYAFAARQFKPYVRELFSLSGENILRDAPADHLHHHGLMYAIRVNGVNFWEETGQPGHERSVKFLSQETGTSPAGLPQARFSQLIHWIKAQDKALPETRSVALLVEQRTITVTVDEAQQEVALEWRGDFTVGPGAAKVTLTGSEYNGLGLRLPQTFDHGARHENSGRLPYAGPGQRDVIAGNWSSVTGSAGGRDMTIALLARPSETRGTTKFFTMLDPFAYLAVTQGLDKAPLEYSGPDTFSVRYLLVVYSTSKTPEFVQQRQQRWERETDRLRPASR